MASLRRAPVPAKTLTVGTWPLPQEAAHYIQNVLRLRPGDAVELFDGQGSVAHAVLQEGGAVQVAQVHTQVEDGPRLTVAAAVPKGDRADWLVEKLTELGVARVQWLQCARSVVIPKPGKGGRWQRVAEAAARQAGRSHVPEIADPVPLAQFVAADTADIRTIAHPGTAPWPSLGPAATATLLIGPEGGFTEEELRVAAAAGYTAASLGRTILRVETAAVAGAALLLITGHGSPP